MPTLDECKELIWQLGEEKGWGKEVATKIYYGMIELGEAGDLWKHREDWDYLKSIGIEDEADLENHMAMEFIDTIFYCLHALRCLNPYLSVDEIFLSKFDINVRRNRVYADDRIE